MADKKPRGYGRDILYLDFDGVLHHHEVWWHPKRGPYIKDQSDSYRLFQHVGLLEHLLAPYPEVDIVLSTTWSRMYGHTAAAKRLPASLRQRVIGSTFHTAMDERNFQSLPRGVQIWNDVLRRKPKAWIAVDDDYLDWPLVAIENFVRTDEADGISAPAVQSELTRKLAKLHGPT